MSRIGMMSSFCRSLVLVSALAAGWLVPSPAAARDGAVEGTGWHGEELPAGLEKTETEGEYRWLRDGSIMVFVPAGTFPMGSTDGDPDEVPVHRIWLDAYYIDKHEVSWGQWKVSGLPYSDRAGSRRPLPEPPDWGIVDDHPMLDVTWGEAGAYARWAGKRLPTEAEWEKAARGADGRTYPWGNEPPSFERALWKDHPVAKRSTLPVDTLPAGASPYGALHMAGNVYEWCQDVYAKDYYARSPAKNPVNLEPGRYRVLRGGAFVLEIQDLRSSLRYRLLEADRAPYIGFRTVLSAVGPGPAED
jgi:formylglycine-generating enzyme required for sulfatase activity